MTDQTQATILQFLRSHQPNKKWKPDQVHDALARTTWAPPLEIEQTRQILADLASADFLRILPDGRYQLAKAVGHPWRKTQDKRRART